MQKMHSLAGLILRLTRIGTMTYRGEFIPYFLSIESFRASQVEHTSSCYKPSTQHVTLEFKPTYKILYFSFDGYYMLLFQTITSSRALPLVNL